MGRRYSDITGSARLRPALDKYIAYLQGTGTRPSRINTRGPRGASKAVFVLPFGFDLPTDTVVGVNVKPDDFTALGPEINAAGTGGEVVDALGTKSAVERPGFSPARIVYFFNTSRSVTVATSEITGLEYLKYAGTRQSCPFGRKTATDDMEDAFQMIKLAILDANTNQIKRVSLTKERLSYS